MKRLIATLAVIALAPSAFAATDWSWDANTRIRYEQHDNTDLNDSASDNNNFIEQRNLLGISMSRGETSKGRITLGHNANWGGNSTFQNGSGSADNLFAIIEAWGWVKLADNVSARMGRYAWQLDSGLLISKLGDETVGAAYDGLWLTYEHDMFDATLASMRNVDEGLDDAVGAADDQDTTYGVVVDGKGVPFLNKASVHYFSNTRDAGVAGAGSSVVRNYLGLEVGGETAGADYRVTFDTVSGETGNSGNDQEGSMLDLEVGYTLPMYKMRVHAGFHTDTGDKDATDTKDSAYSAINYDFHEEAGLMDVLAWGNLTYMRFGVSGEFMGTNIMVEHFTFTRTEKDDGTTGSGKGFNTSTHGGGLADLAGNNSDELGTEIDVLVSRTYDNGVTAGLRYGVFSPGASLNTGSDDNHTQLVFEAGMAF